MRPLRLILTSALFVTACAADSNGGTASDPERGGIGKADLIGNCEADDCGGPASAGNCWCDDSCIDFGDCCSDYGEVCEALPCLPDDCGEPPIFVHCADGVSIATPDLCTILEDGACGWTAQCALDPEPEPGNGSCAPDDCGEPPVFVHCADGVSIAEPDVCTQLEDGNCGWTATCALPDPDAICTTAECGPNPGFIPCESLDLMSAADVCGELPEGGCGWSSSFCPANPTACTPDDCGDKPIFVHCADGFSIAEPDVCTTLEDGNCGWTASCALE